MEQFTYVKRGYDPEEVDRYISTLEQVIKSYKEKDNAIKNAIISAQVAADNMIKNAKAQADEYKLQIVRELDKVSEEVERHRIRMQAFQDVYTSLVRKYLTEVDTNEMSDLFKRLDDVDRLVKRLKESDMVPAPGNEAPGVGLPGPAPAMSEPSIDPLSDDAPNPFAPAQQPINATFMSPPKSAQQPSPISLGPSTSPSLNKAPLQPGHVPPPAVRVNDDGNFVPNS